jgi:hypothetical protein
MKPQSLPFNLQKGEMNPKAIGEGEYTTNVSTIKKTI